MRSRTAVVGLTCLLAVSATACGSRHVRPRPFPAPGTAGGPELRMADRAPTPTAASIVDTALSLTGIPYRYGGSDPGGFDCSGFVWYVFARNGFDVPRTVADLVTIGRAIDPARIAPGDLLFFETKARGPSHVGIAVGSGRFVHAPNARGVVRVEPLSGSYWPTRFVEARRVSK